MTQRQPLVIVSGAVRELPAGDTISGVSTSSAPTYAASDYQVPANTQALLALPVTCDGYLILDGHLVEIF